jgi:regulator of protease activity HflC (stomatin/prohibitin superfamily)
VRLRRKAITACPADSFNFLTIREAIREKRARIIKADGELEAATKLNEAAAIIAPHPSALELRRLQALTEIGVEHNSVIIVSLPVENNATAMSAARQIDR